MTFRRAASILAYFDRISGGAVVRAADADLLARFSMRQDNDAFTELVRRHGPMVLAVCRRELGNLQDAEDAFQATFLVLATRPRAVSKPAGLANWLYAVARRIARRVQMNAVRQRRRDRLGARSEGVEHGPDSFSQEVKSILDAEIARLPARIREAFVLCTLEGLTQEEAGRQLGVPGGTVASRLSRARQRLRDRLLRRGMTYSTLAAFLATLEAPAAVPSAAFTSLVLAVTSRAAGPGSTASLGCTRAAFLMEGVLKAMWMTKLKMAAAALLAVTALGIGLGAVVTRAAQSGSDFRRSTHPTAQSQKDRAVAESNSAPPPAIAPNPAPPEAKDKSREPGMVAIDDAQDDVDLMTARVAIKKGELQAAVFAAQRAAASAARAKDLHDQKVLGNGEYLREKSLADEAMTQTQIKEAELREPEILLRKARRHLDALRAAAARTVAKVPKDTDPKPSAAHEVVELAEAQVAIQRARLRETKMEAEAAAIAAGHLRKMAATNMASPTDVARAENEARTKGAKLEVRQAELAEAEIRLRHARRRADDQEKAESAGTDAQRMRELEMKIDHVQRQMEMLKKK